MTRKSKSEVTAAELIAELESDPEYVARRQGEERRIAEEEARLREEEAPLLADLRAVGFHALSSWSISSEDLEERPDVIPILLDHLRRDYSPGVREGIARALECRASRGYWDVILPAYHCEKQPEVREALAAALAASATKDDVDLMLAKALDATAGDERLLFLWPIGTYGRERAVELLECAKSDPYLRAEAEASIRRIAKRRKRPAR